MGQLATTLRQVAAAAGVSVATASRALRGSTAVVESTRQRVADVAARLDYAPSRLARSLVTGVTGNVGVIVPDITNPFFTPFLAELEAELGGRDTGLLIGNAQESAEREADLVRRMASQVDALVLGSSRMSDEQVVQAASRLPVVLVNRRLAVEPDPALRLVSVVIDVAPGFTAAVRHLHDLGHTAICYLDDPSPSWSAAQKRRALHAACAELGMALSVVGTTRPDFAGGREAGARVVAGGATAVLTYNDQVALGVLSACLDAGHDVPARVSLVGCDDALPAGLARPALTTVDSSSRALGALTAAALLDPDGTGAATVTTRLVVRASTGPAAVPRPIPHQHEELP